MNDPNLYIKSCQKGNVALISLYVDDLIITRNASQLIDKIKRQLSQVFEMKDLGELHYFLGLEIWREVGQTLVIKRKYTREILKRFNTNQCKVVSIPLEHNAKIYNDDGMKEVDRTLYRQLVGILNYLTITKLDIAYSMSILSQFMTKPHESH